jgi:hypothetical protein
MDPQQTYQQMMVQQLMNGANAAPGTTGQNATTPYGQAFMTGNQSMPNASQNYGMLGSMPNSGSPNVLQQPMQTYPGA